MAWDTFIRDLLFVRVYKGLTFLQRFDDNPSQIGSLVGLAERNGQVIEMIPPIGKGLGDGESFIWKSLVWQKYRLR